MIPYLLYVALLLAVCWMFYKLLLHKETFYRLNRLILLSCLGISFALPLIHVPPKWKLAQPGTKPQVITHVRITPDLDTLKLNPATPPLIGKAASQPAPLIAPV